MHDLVYFNDRICPAADPQIGAVTSAALYGRGVFTTVAIRKSEPFLWQKHLTRLYRDSEKIGIDLPSLSREELEQGLRSCIKANKIDCGRARITIFDESPSKIWPSGVKGGISVLIIMAEDRAVSELKLTVAASTINSRSPLAGVKSCNYLETVIAWDKAKARGFDEAVLLNERGAVSSACVANVFWLASGTLFTPALTTGCLPGTTREFVLENVECREIEAGIEALDEAEAIFLTSAGIGIKAVSEFDGRRLPEITHPILSLLR